MSSVTTVVGFQHAFTDDAKLRLLQCREGLPAAAFLLLDFIFHVVPAFVSCSLVGSNVIHTGHLALAYAWILAYYATVVGGFDCSFQYVRLPWNRQVLAAALTPVLFQEAWNSSRVVWFVLAAAYVKEWYDLNDSIRRHVLLREAKS